jgi:hypothetical protein
MDYPKEILDNSHLYYDSPSFMCLAPLGPSNRSNRSKWIKLYIQSCRLDSEMGHCRDSYGSDHGGIDPNPAAFEAKAMQPSFGQLLQKELVRLLRGQLIRNLVILTRIMTLSHQYEGANAPDYEKTDPSLNESVCLSTDKSGSLSCQTAMLQAVRVVAQLCRTQNLSLCLP